MEPLPAQPSTTADKLMQLEIRVSELEGRIPHSSIISRSFWARAWTVIGYQIAVWVMVYAIGLGFMLLFGLLPGLTK